MIAIALGGENYQQYRNDGVRDYKVKIYTCWKKKLHKGKSIIGSRCVWNNRAEAGMLSDIQRPEISMAVH